MSVSGIGSSYNNYYSNAVQNKKTTVASETKFEATSKTTDDVLNNLKEKYSNLNFSSGYNTKGAGSSGLGNVILHPNLLNKMAADPEFAAKAENNIKHIPQAEAWKKNMCAANGMNLVSSGCFVDEDGNIAGSWSYVETANADSKGDKNKDLFDELLEKHRADKTAMAALLAKKEEQEKSSFEINEYGAYSPLKIDKSFLSQEAREQRKADFAQALSRSVTIDPLDNEFQILGVTGIFNDGTLEKHISDSLEGRVKNASLVADELGKMIRGTIHNPDASIEERATDRETALKHASYIAENYFDNPDESKAFLDGINKFAENDIMREKGYIVLDNSDMKPFKSYESPVNSYGDVSWETYAKKAGFSSAREIFADKDTLYNFYTSLHDNSKVWDEELTKSFEDNEKRVEDVIRQIKNSLSEDKVASSLQRLMKAF